MLGKYQFWHEIYNMDANLQCALKLQMECVVVVVVVVCHINAKDVWWQCKLVNVCKSMNVCFLDFIVFKFLIEFLVLRFLVFTFSCALVFSWTFVFHEEISREPICDSLFSSSCFNSSSQGYLFSSLLRGFKVNALFIYCYCLWSSSNFIL